MFTYGWCCLLIASYRRNTDRYDEDETGEVNQVSEGSDIDEEEAELWVEVEQRALLPPVEDEHDVELYID